MSIKRELSKLYNQLKKEYTTKSMTKSKRAKVIQELEILDKALSELEQVK